MGWDLFFGDVTSGLERLDLDDADDFFWKLGVVLKARMLEAWKLVRGCWRCWRRTWRHCLQIGFADERVCRLDGDKSCSIIRKPGLLLVGGILKVETWLKVFAGSASIQERAKVKSWSLPNLMRGSTWRVPGT